MSKRKASMPQEPTGKIARADSSGKNPCIQEQLKTQKSGVTASSSLGTTKKSENSTTTPSGSKSSEQKLKNLAFEAGTKKNGDHQASLATKRSMPSNSELEAVITTLESNDTYKIFAEPVDARKVPGYYRRIKEPMDFATLRGKLQKGIYTSLDQFERDVHLIFNNAMVANPPTTIFYKEASNLQALALKKFIALKLDQDMVKFNEIVRSVEQDCNEQVDIKIEIEESGGLNESEPSAGKVCNSVSQKTSGKASPLIGQSLSGKANPSVGQISSVNASTSIGQSSSGIVSTSIPQSSSGKENPSIGQLSAGKANPSIGQISSGNASTSIGQSSSGIASPSIPQSSSGKANPSLGQSSAGKANPSIGQSSPGAYMGQGVTRPEPALMSATRPLYKVEVFCPMSNMPTQGSFQNASNDFDPLDFLPDWLRQSQPGYDVQVTIRNSSLPRQEGSGSTRNTQQSNSSQPSQSLP